MKQPFPVTNSQARQLFLERQGLSTAPTAKLTNDGLLEIIRSLGFVQVDSINTVARAHHMILFARNQTYRPAQLKRLLETDRTLFEHWTHDASIVPMAYYPYWKHRFLREQEALRARWRKWQREGFEGILTDIYNAVAKNGPTMTREVTSRGKKGDGWWDWKPEKTALEYHWRTGNLAISGRNGFQKIYDITENVIPQSYRQEHVSETRFLDWACDAALTRLGIATPGEIAAFWNLITPKEAANWVQDNLQNGRIIPVLVEPYSRTTPNKAVAFNHLPERLSDLPETQKRIRILSPFDPLIRDRKRCLRLFGFDYRIEVFVPKEKRRYGYYVFPILQGDRFIGRLDMINQKDILHVTGLWLEPGIKFGKDRRRLLEAELHRQRRFVGAHTLSISRTCDYLA